ncbi:hypothetical protein LCGC14_0619510 [marine sediment metagenome]|uniref:Uncharacterized protein n=1 Tax=marine sediment metagenome TaxID=412755 RepID=A0A0F9RAA6_9ZZZZ
MFEPLETLTMIDGNTGEEVKHDLIRWEKKETTLNTLKAQARLIRGNKCQQ